MSLSITKLSDPKGRKRNTLPEGLEIFLRLSLLSWLFTWIGSTFIWVWFINFLQKDSRIAYEFSKPITSLEVLGNSEWIFSLCLALMVIVLICINYFPLTAIFFVLLKIFRPNIPFSEFEIFRYADFHQKYKRINQIFSIASIFVFILFMTLIGWRVLAMKEICDKGQNINSLVSCLQSHSDQLFSLDTYK